MTTISIIRSDITSLHVDAIVNAANSTLMGGGGVDGAIHIAAGPKLLEACKEIRSRNWPDGLPTGQVALTPGFNLPARFVIHTVGPIYGQEAELLASCYTNSLQLAEVNKLVSIAFPAISCGVYGYPLEEAALVALGAVKAYSDSHATTGIRQIILVLFDERAYTVFHRAYELLIANV
jgi:O-acetyl-ADP-ribose deacetylase (regulator of RNase III)